MDSVVIGDGKSQSIANVGSLLLMFSGFLTFSNALHVPNMSRNLLLVSCLCAENDVDVVFSPCDFQVKDRCSGDVWLHGPHVNGLYYWPSISSPTPIALCPSYKPYLRGMLVSTIPLLNPRSRHLPA